jgi:hypothetical protein
MSKQDLPAPQLARGMKLIGQSDIGGRRDGIQIMVHRGYAYIGHIFSRGFSIVDVHDPAAPKAVGYVAAPPNTWNVHLQVADGLLLVINGKDVFADPTFADERSYYQAAAGTALGTASGTQKRDWTGGMAVYDLADPAKPRRIGFMAVPGSIHRIWYVGGRWAYMSALLEGFNDFIFITVDMSDPANPKPVGRYWLPGMNTAAGEEPTWPTNKKYGLHHAIVSGDIAYGAWRDAGLVIMDVADKANPKLIVHRNWAPPFGGGTHNALPIPERDLLIVLDESVLDHQEDGEKLIWVFDIREVSNPVSVATFPSPADADYAAMGGHFGPHNLHENRPGSFVSQNLIFTTYQNAGVRVFDISNAYRPKEVAALVPAAPKGLMDPRPNRSLVIQSADLFVDAQGLVYVTDYNAGLSILEYTA